MTGVIIGRFQVPYLHPGHLHLIATALRECEDVQILLATKHPSEWVKFDERNPYNTADRVRTIKKIFPQVKIAVKYDLPRDDKKWSEEIDEWLDLMVEPVLYHSRDSFKEVYSGKYPLRQVEQVGTYSGTEVRKEHFMNQEVKEKWLAALRSGKYKKGETLLRASPTLAEAVEKLAKGDQHSEDLKYCCLGVLCDLYIEEKGEGEWGNRDSDGSWDFLLPGQEASRSMLPRRVAEWANINRIGTNPRLQGDNSIAVGLSSLASLNDHENSGEDFSKIADIIEEYF